MSARTGRWGGIAMTVPCESGRCKETLDVSIVLQRPCNRWAQAAFIRRQSNGEASAVLSV